MLTYLRPHLSRGGTNLLRCKLHQHTYNQLWLGCIIERWDMFWLDDLFILSNDSNLSQPLPFCGLNAMWVYSGWFSLIRVQNWIEGKDKELCSFTFAKINHDSLSCQRPCLSLSTANKCELDLNFNWLTLTNQIIS